MVLNTAKVKHFSNNTHALPHFSVKVINNRTIMNVFRKKHNFPQPFNNVKTIFAGDGSARGFSLFMPNKF